MASNHFFDQAEFHEGFDVSEALNDETTDKLANGYKEILGFMPIKTACVTCKTPDEKIPKRERMPENEMRSGS